MFEQTSQLVKVTVLVLFVLLIGFVFVILNPRGLVGSFGVDSEVLAPGSSQQVGNSSPFVLPATLSMEEAQKQINDIQSRVNAGTLSLEDARRQMNMVSARVDPPELPDEIKKQIEAKKEAQ